MNQQCGQVWLNTWSEIGHYYSATNPLESLQIVTWNDYEEGSEIESGIDNCASIAAAVSGTTLSWTLDGNENTLDHYLTLVSMDGENLMPLASASTGINALDLAQFNFGPGTYTLYVKAVGKPSVVNHMSPAVTFSVAAPPPVVALNVTPTAGLVPAAITASTDGSSSAAAITSSTLDFGDGTVVNATTATHVYASPGSYTVTGTVGDSAGHEASKNRAGRDRAGPTASQSGPPGIGNGIARCNDDNGGGESELCGNRRWPEFLRHRFPGVFRIACRGGVLIRAEFGSGWG